LLLGNYSNIDKREDPIRLQELLAANKKLAKVYIYKDDLKHLWTTTTQGRPHDSGTSCMRARSIVESPPCEIRHEPQGSLRDHHGALSLVAQYQLVGGDQARAIREKL
jgi:hypothetical protein